MKKSIQTIIKEDFSKKSIIVIGDLMVDEYVTGKVTRISPEAPVPVLNFEKRSLTAGGASNVACNLKALGAEVTVIGTAGNDVPGIWLREDLKKEGVNIDGILEDGSRQTTIKTRYATKGQQLLRIDNEMTEDIQEETKNRILKLLEGFVKTADAVVLSDYCKGIFHDGDFVRRIIEICNENKVFISIDSKRRDIQCFAGADLVKPNNLELESAVGIKITDDESLDRAGKTYLDISGIKMLVVTRGSRGISVFGKDMDRQDFSADTQAQVFDVTGAGDTVISTATLAYISGADTEQAMILANMAAGIVITRIGTVSISGEELYKYAEEKNI